VTEKTAKASPVTKAASVKNGKGAAGGKPVIAGKGAKPSKEADKGKKEPERSAKDAASKDPTKKDPTKKEGAKGAVAKGATKPAADGAKGAKVKDGAAAKPKDAPPKRKRKSSVVRLKAYWGVFNQMLKRVAVFEYAERKQADKKAAELSTSAKQPHFVQLVKEVIRDED